VRTRQIPVVLRLGEARGEGPAWPKPASGAQVPGLVMHGFSRPAFRATPRDARDSTRKGLGEAIRARSGGSHRSCVLRGFRCAGQVDRRSLWAKGQPRSRTAPHRPPEAPNTRAPTPAARSTRAGTTPVRITMAGEWPLAGLALRPRENRPAPRRCQVAAPQRVGSSARPRPYSPCPPSRCNSMLRMPQLRDGGRR
jgi:hypothetical protein